jgi:hypothetical protein
LCASGDGFYRPPTEALNEESKFSMAIGGVSCHNKTLENKAKPFEMNRFFAFTPVDGKQNFVVKSAVCVDAIISKY